MSDSQIENLLQQMTLAEPSAELDLKVSASLHATDALPATLDSRSSVSWGMVVAAAVVFLLIGVFVGRSTATSQVAEGKSSESSPGHTAAVDESGGGNSWQPTAHGDVVRTFRDHPETMLHQKKPVPEIAVLCALNTMSAPGKDEGRCLTCHIGFDHARRRFKEEHVWHLKQEACHLCHDMTDKQNRPDEGRLDAIEKDKNETQALNVTSPPGHYAANETPLQTAWLPLGAVVTLP